MPMLPMDRFGIYVGSVGDNILPDLLAVDCAPASQITEVVAGGALDRAAIITSHADPTFRLLTRALGAITNIPLDTGYRVDSLNAPTTAVSLFQYQKRTDGGAFVASATAQHGLISSAKGFCVVEEISAAQDDPAGAQVSLLYYALSEDGITHPFNFTASAALTATPNAQSQYYLGNVYLGNIDSAPSKLGGVVRVSIRPGLLYVPRRADGDVFAQVGSIVGRRPEIRLTLLDLDDFHDRLGGACFGRAQATALNCMLYQGTHGGTRLDLASAVHCNISAATSADHVESVSVRETDDAMYEVTFRPNSTLAFTLTENDPNG